MSTVVSKQVAGMVKQPHRKPDGHRSPALCILVPSEIKTIANMVSSAIERIERARGCGAFLFVTDDMDVHVISEERPVAMTWMREHYEWCVAYYRTRDRSGKPGLAPTPEGIEEDLSDHLLKVASATAGREYGGSQLAGGDNSQPPVNGVPGSGGADCSPTVGVTSFRHGSGEGFGHA